MLQLYQHTQHWYILEWIYNKIREFTKRIKQEEQAKRSGNNSTPTHIV